MKASILNYSLLISFLFISFSISAQSNSIVYSGDVTNSTGIWPGSPVLMDFDQDGYNDILFKAWPQLYLHLNDGAGGFGSFSLLPIAYANYVGGDLDNDGDPDLVGSNGHVYINDGSGVFTRLGSLTILNGPGSISALKIADFNNDGKLDIILGNGSNSGGAQNEVWLNTGSTGSANFSFSVGVDNLSPSAGINSIDVGDIDGDGDNDIVTGSSSWRAAVYENNSGALSLAQNPSGYGGGIRLHDWDLDGDLDMIGYDSYNGFGLTIRRNDGSGTFAPYETLFSNGFGYPSAISLGWNLQGGSNTCSIADLNGDGFLDVVVDRWVGNARVLINEGCKMVMEPYELSNSSYGAHLADFDNDGKIDVFCAARSAISSVWRNELNTVVAVPLSNVTSTTPGATVGPGTVDLSASVSNGGTHRWYSSVSGGSILGNGSTYTTPVINQTTSYYVSAINANGCESAREEVVATFTVPVPTVGTWALILITMIILPVGVLTLKKV